MSVQSEINRLKQNVNAAFTAIGNKGGTVPTSKVSGNLASAIDSIPEGVELNFEVVYNPKPSTAKENTIWVDTDEINNYYFSATQPDGMQPTDVWFLTGTKSNVEFNALKKNEITVHPIEAVQMTDVGLVSVEAMIYQDGAWTKVDPKKYVFKSGSGFDATVYKKLTTSASSIYIDSHTSLPHSISSDKTFVVLDSKASGNICHLAFDIDLTEYKTMYIDATVSKSNSSSAEMIIRVGNEGVNNITNLAETKFIPKSDGVRETFTYPVDNISVVKRVVIYTRNGRKATIHNIGFE
jgi:hypothetical protein